MRETSFKLVCSWCVKIANGVGLDSGYDAAYIIPDTASQDWPSWSEGEGGYYTVVVLFFWNANLILICTIYFTGDWCYNASGEEHVRMAPEENRGSEPCLEKRGRGGGHRGNSKGSKTVLLALGTMGGSC